MKTYKLKKDLPLAKTGEEVEIYEKWKNLIRIYKKPNNNRSGILICQIEKENISEWLEEIREQKTVWDLKEGYEYFCLDSEGSIDIGEWNNNLYHIDVRLNGNIFLTYEEAKKERERRNAITTIQKYCWENNIDNSWKENDYEVRYYFCLSLEEEKVEFFYPRDDQKPYSPIGYFSWDNANKILKEFPKELELIYS